MRHGVNKIKFKRGSDANRMLMRKLAKNFVVYSKLETTLKKAKALRSLVERMADKSKEKTEANKNYLLSNLADDKLVRKLFNEIGPLLKNKQGGYTRLVRLGVRTSDGAETARLEWTVPIVAEKPSSAGSKEVKKTKPSTASPEEVKDKKAKSK